MPHLLQQTAPAKLTLNLHITGRRADGYHILDMLVVFLDLADTITAHPTPQNQHPKETLSILDGFEIQYMGRFGAMLEATLPDTKSSSLYQALDWFFKAYPHSLPFPFTVQLDKAIPIAAGLGGGSANAAAMIRLLQRMMGNPQHVQNLSLSGLTQLGADVPMCYAGLPARAIGIGEEIQPLSHGGGLPIVLINAGIPVSTPKVFQTYRDTPDLKFDVPLQNLPEDSTGSPFIPSNPQILAEYLKDNTQNSLEAVACTLCQEIALILKTLRQHPDCLLARMAGSGGTCFGIFGSKEAAKGAEEDLRQALGSRLPKLWVKACRSLENPM